MQPINVSSLANDFHQRVRQTSANANGQGAPQKSTNSVSRYSAHLPVTPQHTTSALHRFSERLKKEKIKQVTIRSKQSTSNQMTPTYTLTISPEKVQLIDQKGYKKNHVVCNIPNMKLTHNDRPCSPDQFRQFLSRIKEIHSEIKTGKTTQKIERD